jgi:hypothetical protein
VIGKNKKEHIENKNKTTITKIKHKTTKSKRTPLLSAPIYSPPPPP